MKICAFKKIFLEPIQIAVEISRCALDCETLSCPLDEVSMVLQGSKILGMGCNLGLLDSSLFVFIGVLMKASTNNESEAQCVAPFSYSLASPYCISWR